MYHKVASLIQTVWISMLILCVVMRFFLLFLYHIYIFKMCTIVGFDIFRYYNLLVLFNYFFFTQAVKTILHFIPEREHLDSEEATAFFFSFCHSYK